MAGWDIREAFEPAGRNNQQNVTIIRNVIPGIGVNAPTETLLLPIVVAGTSTTIEAD